MFPTGTPRATIDRLNGALRVGQQEMKDGFLRVGAAGQWSTPEQMVERSNRDRPWQEAVPHLGRAVRVAGGGAPLRQQTGWP